MKRRQDHAEAGRECVWDYPRPPRLESTSKEIRVEFGGQVLARTNAAYRVLETSHPPVYYVPQSDIRLEFFEESGGGSYCEWKGAASYYDVVVGGKRLQRVAWFYAKPTAAFRDIRGYVAFYPSAMDGCYVAGERVDSQRGDFYGGWITSDIEGPFKGGPGTRGW
jgi:uncharacterized protein (DUF427 family)